MKTNYLYNLRNKTSFNINSHTVFRNAILITLKNYINEYQCLGDGSVNLYIYQDKNK